MRLSYTEPQILVVKEWAETYFEKYPGKRVDPLYAELYERVCEHLEKIREPLLVAKTDHSLLDTEWNFQDES